MHLVLVNNAYVDGVGARQDTVSAEEEDEEEEKVKLMEKMQPGSSIINHSGKAKEVSVVRHKGRALPL